jgi:hypothetical protein
MATVYPLVSAPGVGIHAGGRNPNRRVTLPAAENSCCRACAKSPCLVWCVTNNCAGDMLTAKRIHGETLSPLDATVYKGKARAGQLPSDLTGRGAGVAVEEPALRATARPDPKGKYLDCMPWLPCNCGRCSSVGFNEVLI